MKRYSFIVLVAAVLLSQCPSVSAKDLVVADFKSRNFTNNLGVGFGAWDRDPTDETQSCSVSIIKDKKHKRDSVLEVVYDVDSPNPAYNGIWVKLNNIDMGASDFLVLWVKGDTATFKVEIKSEKETGYYYLNGITQDWQEFLVPLSDIRNISDFSNLKEMTVVFDDIHATNKVGKIYLDDISFRVKGSKKEAAVETEKASAISLKGVNLSGSNLSGVILTGADMSHTNLQKVNLYSAVLDSVNLSKSSLSESDLTGATLMKSNLCESRVDKAVLRKVNLSEAVLDNADLKMSDLTRADLTKASLKNADLRLTDLRRANLKGVDFTGAKVGGANFYKAEGLTEKTKKYLEENGAINIYEENL